MVGSNERGRALEYKIGIEIDSFLARRLKLDVRSSENTKHLNFRDKAYFDVLDQETKDDFGLCAKAAAKWIGQQDWFKDAQSITIDRFSDDKAKERNPTDIQLVVSDNKGQLVFKNLSIKNRSDSLCHPRLPSLPEQCGITDKKVVERYRENYKTIWNAFYLKVKALGVEMKYSKVPREFKFGNLYEPLQRNAVNFLQKHANTPEAAKEFFTYLTGAVDYYVVKNENKCIKVKHFVGIKPPTAFDASYPCKSKTSYLLKFNNGWDIKVRVHTITTLIENKGDINITEKEDPICKNLEDVIQIDKIEK